MKQQNSELFPNMPKWLKIVLGVTFGVFYVLIWCVEKLFSMSANQSRSHRSSHRNDERSW